MTGNAHHNTPEALRFWGFLCGKKGSEGMKWVSSLTAVRIALVCGVLAVANATAYGAEQRSFAVEKDHPKSTPQEKLASVRLNVGNHRCSATAIATHGGLTLVISCNHCFATQPYPGAQFPRANYPIKCQILTNDESKSYDAIAIDGDARSDLAIIVVPKELPVCPISTGQVGVGDSCYHYGRTSGLSRGKITRWETQQGVPPDQTQRSTCSSIPGDSGAGVFVGGKYVATLWGRWNTGEQGGTAVRAVLDTIQRSAPLRKDYPKLWDSVPRVTDVPTLPGNVSPGPDLVPIPGCPGGVCPVPQPSPRFPILRRIIRR